MVHPYFRWFCWRFGLRPRSAGVRGPCVDHAGPSADRRGHLAQPLKPLARTGDAWASARVFVTSCQLAFTAWADDAPDGGSCHRRLSSTARGRRLESSARAGIGPPCLPLADSGLTWHPHRRGSVRVSRMAGLNAAGAWARGSGRQRCQPRACRPQGSTNCRRFTRSTSSLGKKHCRRRRTAQTVRSG